MSKQPGFFRRMMGGLGRALSFTRNFILNLIFLVVLLFFVSAFFAAPDLEVPEGAAVVIRPEGIIVEQQSYIDPFAGLLGSPLNTAVSSETLLRDILAAIDTAREDNRIGALVLELDRLGESGFSKLQEIGTALEAFSDSGKKIYAVSDAYTQHQYYLAAYADEILLHSMGSVELQGFHNYQAYFKSALDKLRVNMHVFRVGEFKSAVEPFVRDSMSEAARQDSSLWLNDLWQFYLADVAAQRELSPTFLQDLISNLDQHLANYGGNYAQMALQSGLVDKVGNRIQTRQYLADELGLDAQGEDYRQMDYRTYLSAHGEHRDAPQESTRKVGIIVASGIIYDGEQRPGSIGGDTLATLIRAAREDDTVRALVLRIDSGGGSAFASEVIRQELLALKQAGKPLVVSMSSVAASGGYWIASPADEIWASPSTLTGSIGIFALYPTFEQSLAGLGINTDGVGTTELAGAYTMGRELPELASKVVQQVLADGYEQFINIVSEGRGMTHREVDSLAQGRVWSGQQALEVGLVDKLGNLEQAVQSAASLADIEDYDTVYIEQGLTPAEQLLRELSDAFRVTGLSVPGNTSTVGQLLSFYRQLNGQVQAMLRFNDPRGLYLHCFECSVQ